MHVTFIFISLQTRFYSNLALKNKEARLGKTIEYIINLSFTRKLTQFKKGASKMIINRLLFPTII